MARKSYGHALRLTNTALRNPDEAPKDTTMLSVLVLGLFEASMDHSPRGLRAWQQHINGAAELARMRGSAQFKTRPGIKSKCCQKTKKEEKTSQKTIPYLDCRGVDRLFWP